MPLGRRWVVSSTLSDRPKYIPRLVTTSNTTCRSLLCPGVSCRLCRVSVN